MKTYHANLLKEYVCRENDKKLHKEKSCGIQMMCASVIENNDEDDLPLGLGEFNDNEI